MKKCAILIAAWVCFAATYAQTKTEKHIKFSGKESLELNIQIADSIDVQSWDRNEVYVTASVNINENKDNDAYLISYPESGNNVEIKANFKKDYFKGRDNSCTKSDIRWKVFVPERIPFSVETINGNITITGRTGEMKVKTISGFIDLAVPVSKQADIEFSTISGTVFTDHKLAMETRSTGIPSVIKEKLNNGGSLIKLGTISGDIFFRKSD
jgi:hypothetical protein